MLFSRKSIFDGEVENKLDVKIQSSTGTEKRDSLEKVLLGANDISCRIHLESVFINIEIELWHGRTALESRLSDVFLPVRYHFTDEDGEKVTLEERKKIYE